MKTYDLKIQNLADLLSAHRNLNLSTAITTAQAIAEIERMVLSLIRVGSPTAMTFVEVINKRRERILTNSDAVSLMAWVGLIEMGDL